MEPVVRPEPARRDGVHLLITWVWLWIAGAALAVDKQDAGVPDLAALPLIRIEAEISADFQEIRGTLEVVGAEGVHLIDPLARMPDPDEDRTALRTWPGRAERGRIRFYQGPDGLWTFVTWLPRRYDDVGWWKNQALYANGYWYPQPMTGDRPVVGTWTVDVRLPPGATGAVGESVATERVRWVGHGERASLAVLQDGRITPIHAPGVDLNLLTRGRPRAAWVNRAAPLLASARPAGEQLTGVVVEAPLRRRLVRPGVGLAYLSDRAWRLSPGLARYHDRPILRGLLRATLKNHDPAARDLAATVLSDPGPDATRLLRRFRWNPVVDAILNDRTLPFWADILGPGESADPLRDDLWEVLAPRPPTIDALHQVQTQDPTAPASFAHALARGRSVEAAAREAGIALDLNAPPPRSPAPTGLVVTWAAWIDRFNPTAGWLEGQGTIWARDRRDTRNIALLGVSVDQRNLPGLALGWSHQRGPLQSGLRRPHRISVWVEPAWSNARFSNGENSVFTVGGGASYTWDSRVSELFPLEGGRVRASASGGIAPWEGTSWAVGTLSGAGLLSPHPRVVFAGRGLLGVGAGDTAERLLWLGGPGSGSGLPPRAAFGDRLVSGEGEVRLAPLRHASIPLGGWAWLAEVQVSAGWEAAWLRGAESPAAMTGWTTGLAVVTELLGARPGLIGVSVAQPVQTWGLSSTAPQTPQITLRLGQPF